MSLVDGELDLHVLAEINLVGEIYPYAVFKAIKNRGHRIETNLSTLYLVVGRLHELGHIEPARIVEIPLALTTGKPSERVRHYFRITASGKAVLRQKIAIWQSTIARIQESIGRADDQRESKRVL